MHARSVDFDATPAAEAATGDIEALRLECRQLVRRRALLAAATSFIPVPGLDVVTDVAVLFKLMPEINSRFGLTSAQISRLVPAQRILVYRLMVSGGSVLASNLATAPLLLALLRRVGVRLTVMEATRLVPIVGQAIAAGIGFWALNYVAGRHVDACAEIARQLRRGE